jgi:hypothetical protein
MNRVDDKAVVKDAGLRGGLMSQVQAGRGCCMGAPEERATEREQDELDKRRKTKSKMTPKSARTRKSKVKKRMPKSEKRETNCPPRV